MCVNPVNHTQPYHSPTLVGDQLKFPVASGGDKSSSRSSKDKSRSRSKSFLTQIKPQFHSPGEGAGYCGAKYLHIPENNEAPYALSTKEDVTSKQTIEY